MINLNGQGMVEDYTADLAGFQCAPEGRMWRSPGRRRAAENTLRQRQKWQGRAFFSRAMV